MSALDHWARWSGYRDGPAECWRSVGPNRRGLEPSYGRQERGCRISCWDLGRTWRHGPQSSRCGASQKGSSRASAVVFPRGDHGYTGSRMGWCGIPSRLAVWPTPSLSIVLGSVCRGCWPCRLAGQGPQAARRGAGLQAWGGAELQGQQTQPQDSPT